MKRILYFLFFLTPYLAKSQDFMMQAWYWDYPKTTTGANWVGTLNGQASDLSGRFTYMWLPPLAKPSFGNNSNGYDPKDLYDYGQYNNGCPWGTRAGLNSLISTYNANNIKAVGDLVYNHRDGGRAENNPAVENWIKNFAGATPPYPSDRVRCILPIGAGTQNGAGDYYIKIRSNTQNTSNYGGKPYKFYVQTNKVGWQALSDLNESEPNGGGDCGQAFNTVPLGRNIACTTDGSGCLTDEFKVTLTAADFNSVDTLFIYFSNQNGQYSDHRPYAIWSASRSADIANELKYQTYTDFSGLPSGQGSMNYTSFKPNGINPTSLSGDLDWMWFFYDYDQNNTTCQNTLNDWTKWNWENVGIRGFRMDAVKHFPASFVSQLMNFMNANGMNPGMVVGESFDFNPATLSGWVQQVIGGMTSAAQSAINIRVFDFALRGALKEACDGFGFDVRNVYTSGIVGAGGSGFNVVTFLNNHDFRSPGEPIQNDPKLAYAYILTNNKVGLPCVFYPDYYGVSVPNAPTVNLKPQIDQLIDIHKNHIFGSNQLEYLNQEGSGYLAGSNYISAGTGASKATTMIYQIKGGISGRDVIVAINFSGQTLKVDHQINTSGNPVGTKFDDIVGNSAFSFAQVDASNRIYIQLPPRSYSVWLRQSGQPASPVVVASTNVTNVTCNGGNNGSATVSATGGSGCTMSYLWANGQSGPTASNLTAGTYNVIATCGTLTGSYTVTVTQPTAINLSASSSQPVTCINQGTANALASGGTGTLNYVWSNNQTGSFITVPTAGNYTVTVTDANGCKKIAIASVAANQSTPNAQAQTSGNLTCAATTVALSNNTNPSNYTYKWSNNATTTPTTVSQAGNYGLTVTDTSNGCSATSNINVTSNTISPTALISTINPTLTCANPTLALNASSSTGTTPNLTYQWTGTGITSGATTAQATVNQAGTFTVVVKDGVNGCTATKSIAVTSNTTPTNVTATGGTLSCSQSSVTLMATATTNNATFAWSGPNNFTSTLSNPSVSAAGTYTVTATGTNGCKSTATATVTGVNTAPTAQIQAQGALTCINNTVTLSNSVNNANYQYAWATQGGTPTTGTTLNVTQAGTYFLTVTNPANGCSATNNIVITQNKTAPTVQVTPANPTLTCSNTNVVLDASSSIGTSPNLSYVWSAASFSAQLTASQAGNYTVTVTDTGNGCTATQTIVVGTNTNVPIVTGATALGGISCTQPSTSITLSSPGQATYNWSGPNNFTSSTSNPTFTAGGIYIVTVTGSNGCTTTKTLTVSSSIVVPPITLQGGTAICSGASTTLNVAETYPSYNWSNGFGGQMITVNLPNTYTVTVMDSNSCTATATQIVTQAPQPVVNFAVNDTLTCTKLTTTLNASSPNALTTTTWAGPNNFNATNLSPSVTNVGAYTLTAVNSQGCTGQFTTNVYRKSNVPAVFINGNSTICQGVTTTLNATPNLGTYLWSNNKTTNAITTNQAGVYSVTVTNAQGCQGAAWVNVIVSPTPNVTIPTLKVCENASATLTPIVTNSNSVTYNWTGPNNFTANTQNVVFQNASVANAGTYSVSATNNVGCVGKATTTLNVSPAMSVSLAGTVDCAGIATIQATVTGGVANYQYQWKGSNVTTNPLVIATPVLMYVTVTDSYNCKKINTNPLSLSAYTALASVANVTNSAANTATGGIVLIVTGGKAPYTYLWSNGATTKELKNIPAGNYCVTVTDAKGCTKMDCFDVKTIVGAADLALENALRIFPNPVEDLLTIDLSEHFTLTTIRLFDATGKLIQTYPSDTRKIDFSTLPKALYFLHLQTKDGEVVKEVLKE